MLAVPGVSCTSTASEARPGRKMGHLTVLDDDPAAALAGAAAGRAAVGLDPSV